MILQLINNVTKREWEYTVEDAGKYRDYYLFEGLTLNSDMPDGEYTYNLLDKDVIISTGLMRIGDYKAQNKTYDKGKSGYVYYKPKK